MFTFKSSGYSHSLCHKHTPDFAGAAVVAADAGRTSLFVCCVSARWFLAAVPCLQPNEVLDRREADTSRICTGPAS